MTLHPHGAVSAAGPVREIEEAFHRARAASHARRLDTATQAALDALIALHRSTLDRLLQLDAALEQAHERLRALEAAQVFAVPFDP